MIRSPRLAAGDVIRVVAPSGPVPRKDFDAGMAALAGRYQLRFDERLFETEGYLAGSDVRRLHELDAALRDREARAVIMARGGYGLLRLLPLLDPAVLRGAPKPVVGFSDGTALLAHAVQAEVAAIHGPVMTQLGRLPGQDVASLSRLLEDAAPPPLLTTLDSVVPGRVRGPLLGGNLEVFSRLLGTPFFPDPTGAVLFFEDVGERPYRIDRLLTHLDLAGVFGAAAGVVVGDFTGCVEPEATRALSPTVAAVLEERLGRLAIPVAFGAPVGHGARNVALPYGIDVELDTRAGTLAALTGVVI